MFVAIYRWKLKEEQEEKFREGWRRRTDEIYRKCGSLGSRLHRAEDGTWVAYAQWSRRQDWEAARQVGIDDTEAVEMMKESVEVPYTEMLLEVADDLFKTHKFFAAEQTSL
jgi:heme-degrading monooxygenase HmoA